ncbi:hypothetical protein L0F63_001729 [Massospora cicadina]|nr:hypothetical protein L0F63_001729 [Massospora cicadina]
MGFDAREIDTAAFMNAINVYTNAVSGACGLMAVALILTINLIDHRLLDRVSIRFTLAISLVDFLKAGMIATYGKISPAEPLCTLIAFSTQWLTLLYLFLNVAIAVNLQLVFVRGYAFNPLWERAYWFTSFFMATILPTFSLVGGKLGSGNSDEPCEYKHSRSPDACAWMFLTLLVWILASCAYCTVVVALTIVTLRRKATVLDRIAGLDPKAQEVKHDIQRLILRVAFYCIIPVVTQTGFLVGRAVYCFAELPFALRLLAVVGTDIPGILNLIAFFIDPAFSNAVRTIINERYRKAPVQCRIKEADSPDPLWPLDGDDLLGAANETFPMCPPKSTGYDPGMLDPAENASAPAPQDAGLALVGRRCKREVRSCHMGLVQFTEPRSRHSALGIGPGDLETLSQLESNSLNPLNGSPYDGAGQRNLDRFRRYTPGSNWLRTPRTDGAAGLPPPPKEFPTALNPGCTVIRAIEEHANRLPPGLAVPALLGCVALGQRRPKLSNPGNGGSHGTPYMRSCGMEPEVFLHPAGVQFIPGGLSRAQLAPSTWI